MWRKEWKKKKELEKRMAQQGRASDGWHKAQQVSAPQMKRVAEMHSVSTLFSGLSVGAPRQLDMT